MPKTCLEPFCEEAPDPELDGRCEPHYIRFVQGLCSACDRERKIKGLCFLHDKRAKRGATKEDFFAPARPRWGDASKVTVVLPGPRTAPEVKAAFEAAAKASGKTIYEIMQDLVLEFAQRQPGYPMTVAPEPPVDPDPNKKDE